MGEHTQLAPPGPDSGRVTGAGTLRMQVMAHFHKAPVMVALGVQ